jgi:hypothetical protein
MFYVFESGSSDDTGDDASDTGNVGIGVASISSVGMEDIGAGSAGVEDDKEDLETLTARMTQRTAVMCPPDGGEGTNSARCTVRQNSPRREEHDVTVPPEGPVPEPVRETWPGDDRVAGKAPMEPSPVPPGFEQMATPSPRHGSFGGVPRIWRTIRRSGR